MSLQPAFSSSLTPSPFYWQLPKSGDDQHSLFFIPLPNPPSPAAQDKASSEVKQRDNLQQLFRSTLKPSDEKTENPKVMGLGNGQKPTDILTYLRSQSPIPSLSLILDPIPNGPKIVAPVPRFPHIHHVPEEGVLDPNQNDAVMIAPVKVSLMKNANSVSLPTPDQFLKDFSEHSFHSSIPVANETPFPALHVSSTQSLAPLKHKKFDEFKTAPCKSFYLFSRCSFNETCFYAHGEAEIRCKSLKPYFKAVFRPCNKKEECKKVPLCPYLHPTETLNLYRRVLHPDGKPVLHPDGRERSEWAFIWQNKVQAVISDEDAKNRPRYATYVINLPDATQKLEKYYIEPTLFWQNGRNVVLDRHVLLESKTVELN